MCTLARAGNLDRWWPGGARACRGHGVIVTSAVPARTRHAHFTAGVCRGCITRAHSLLPNFWTGLLKRDTRSSSVIDPIISCRCAIPTSCHAGVQSGIQRQLVLTASQVCSRWPRARATYVRSLRCVVREWRGHGPVWVCTARWVTSHVTDARRDASATCGDSRRYRPDQGTHCLDRQLSVRHAIHMC
jgi:hypothetical protein